MFSIGFNWKKNISLDEFPLLVPEKIKLIVDRELRLRNLKTEETADGIKFKGGYEKQNTMINPGGSSLPFLRAGYFSITENNRIVTVKCRNVVLNLLFTIVALIAFIQAYLFFWWNKEVTPLPVWFIPPALLILYFVYYAIFTRVALNSIWKKILEEKAEEVLSEK
jgi:hypothetical protein